MIANAFRRLCLTGLLLLAVGVTARAEEPVRVFAAASLSAPLQDILDKAPAFGGVAEGIYASSGTLARQILSGAPADIFISADPAWSDYLIDNGIVSGDQVAILAGNRLVVIGPLTESAMRDFDMSVLPIFQRGRLAIGDPDHVPAGKYAKQALSDIGLWDSLRGEAIRAPSVRAALAFVEQEAVQYGIVYESDARQSKAVTIISWIPANHHTPIVYTISTLNDRPETLEIASFLTSQAVQSELTSAGFAPVAEVE